jgi:hypothetical protein
MSASIGIWAQRDASDSIGLTSHTARATGESVLYRWEADQETGFVTFEVATRRFRPSDDSGRPIGDLIYDAATGDSQGNSAEVDKGLFSQMVASILRSYARAGQVPITAHAYYY